jgi:transcriptional regulator with XRE-family HTH domain
MALRKFASKEIGNNIRKIRVELRQTQEEFGKEAGDYSQDTVAKWESGQIPHAMILKRIADMGRRTVDSLFGEKKETDGDLDGALAELDRASERIKELAGKGRKKSRR